MTDDAALEKDVRALLGERVASFEQLESLLLLHAAPDRWETLDAIAAKLGVPAKLAVEALDHLRSGALVEQRGAAAQLAFHYAPDSPALAVAVDGLARAYREQPGKVMRLLNTNVIARLRNSAVRAFADSFLLGRKKDDNG